MCVCVCVWVLIAYGIVVLYTVFVILDDETRWEYVMEYSKDIGLLLGNPKSPSGSVIEDPRTVLKVNLLSS